MRSDCKTKSVSRWERYRPRKAVKNECMISCNPFKLDGIVQSGKGRADNLFHRVHHLQSLPEVAPAEVARGRGSVDAEGPCRAVHPAFGYVGVDRAPLLFGKTAHQGVMQVVN